MVYLPVHYRDTVVSNNQTHLHWKNLNERGLRRWLKDWRGTLIATGWGYWVSLPWRPGFWERIWLRSLRFSKALRMKILRSSFRLWKMMAGEDIFKLFKKRCSLDVGRFKFANRVCEEWNGLDDDVVEVGSVNAFKRKLDHHLRNVRGYF